MYKRYKHFLVQKHRSKKTPKSDAPKTKPIVVKIISNLKKIISNVI